MKLSTIRVWILILVLLFVNCACAEEAIKAYEPVTTVPAELLVHNADTAYGAYSHHSYDSSFCGMERGYSIYLPAGYETSDRSYPVIYLLHGIFGNEYSFTADPGNHMIVLFGNMAEQGLAPEVIIVFPDMFAKTNNAQAPALNAEAMKPYDDFIYDLTECLMPHIESTYRVQTGKQYTALAGFSMGGREALFIALQRPDLFGYVCAISPAPGLTPGKDWAMQHPGQLAEDEAVYAEGAEPPYRLLLCCGTIDSVVGTFPASYHTIFERNGVDHIWWEIPGANHDNTAIICGLYNFLCVAFAE